MFFFSFFLFFYFFIHVCIFIHISNNHSTYLHTFFQYICTYFHTFFHYICCFILGFLPFLSLESFYVFILVLFIVIIIIITILFVSLMLSYLFIVYSTYLGIWGFRIILSSGVLIFCQPLWWSLLPSVLSPQGVGDTRLQACGSGCCSGDDCTGALLEMPVWSELRCLCWM